MSTGLLCETCLDTNELASMICNSDLRDEVKDRNCLEDLDVYGRIILKLILNKMEGF